MNTSLFYKIWQAHACCHIVEQCLHSQYILQNYKEKCAHLRYDLFQTHVDQSALNSLDNRPENVRNNMKMGRMCETDMRKL